MQWFWRTRSVRDAELSEELDAHLTMAIAERIARGESRDDAERNARREFGNVTLVAEVTRDMWGGRWLETLMRDTRYAMRGLRRTPTFTIVAVATFALGIGANTAMFTVVNGALLRPLPFDHPEELVLLSHLPKDFPWEMQPSLTDRSFFELRATKTGAFSALATFAGNQMTLTGTGEPEQLATAIVSANFMNVLGVTPAFGRTFLTDEEDPGAGRVVVLGDRLWRERFGADRGIAGKTVLLDGVPHVVIGVMQPGFDFPNSAALWTPLSNRLDSHNWAFRPVVGRLAPGVTADAALGELTRLLAVLPTTANDKADTQRTEILPLLDLVVAKARKSLWILAGAVTFVLLIACANVANLMLIRVSTRRREIGVRAALGASRARVVRQLVTESAVVAVIGGAVGVLLSIWGVRLLLATAPEGRIPRLNEIAIDWRVLVASFVASLVAGIAVGILPALASTRRGPRAALAETGRSIVGGHDRLRRSFVIAQLALAIVLLTGAGLLLKSFARMRAVDPGFRTSGIVTMTMSLSPAAYPTATQMQTFDARVVDRLRQIPGVDAASMVNWMPLTQGGIFGDFHIEGRWKMPKGYTVDKLVAAPGYFQTMGIHLVYGRDFAPGDDGAAMPVTIVSRSVARRFWPPDGAAAIGKRITQADKDPKPNDWLTIVGVVDDVAQQNVTSDRDKALYFPVAQNGNAGFIRDVTFAVRTAQAPGDIAPMLRAIVHESDPSLAVRNIQSMDDIASASMADSRFEAWLLAVLSALALLLAAVGTYGVLAYDVAARTHEIGLRVALGAERHQVMALVFRRTIAVAVPGIMIGVAGAAAITGVLRKALFHVTPTDPSTLASVAGMLLAVALIAAAGPARRAVRVDPLVALKHE